MPDVNLLKDTDKLSTGAPRPPAIGQPELSKPAAASGSGLGSVFKSFFNRAPKALPTSPIARPAAPRGTMSSTPRSRSGERILSETRKAAPRVIPLPADDDTAYNVNLLSEELISTVNPRQRLMALIGIAIGTLVIVGLGYAGLLVYQSQIKQKITTTEQQLKSADAEVAGLTKDQQTAALTVQKINAIHSLLDRHTRWTKFFALLERYTLPTVTYGSSFSGDLNGTVTLTATTTSYEEVAKQYLIFQQVVADQKFISTFQISGATNQLGKDGSARATFVVTMTLLPNDFTLTADEVQALLGATTPTAPPTNTNSSANQPTRP